MSKKFLYLFKEGHDAFGGDQTTMKNILGGKGAGLAEMTHAGMPVPQGFTITTEACTQYYADNREITMRSRLTSSSTWESWKSRLARSSAISRTRCWFPFVPVHVSLCLA